MEAVLAAGKVPQILFDLLLVLATAGCVGLVSRRLHLALIPGYLLAGAVIGPGVLGLVSGPESVQSISDLAIVLLMFTIGLAMSREELRGGMLPILAIGIVSTIGTAVLVTPVAMVFGVDAPRAIAIAMAMSMSSTAVVLGLYQKRRELRSAHGRIVFGTLLTQDLLVVPALAAVPLLASFAGLNESSETGSSGGVVGLLSTALISVGAIGVMIVGGGLALPRILKEATRDTDGELLLIISAAVALGAAGITGVVGFSPELGAFIAGFMLAGTPFRHQLAGQLGPIRDLFMAVFFTAVGLQLNPGAVGSAWWVVPLGVVLITLIKAFTIGGAAWLFGAPPAVATTAGVSLAQSGEFTLVVLFAAAAGGLFGSEVGGDQILAVTIAIVVMSLVVTPFIVNFSRRLGMAANRFPAAPWIVKGTRRPLAAKSDDASESDSDEPATKPMRVVIAGYGPVGRALAERFLEIGAEIVVIELNAATVRTQMVIGQRTVYGDASNPNVLEEAGVESADAVVLTLPDEQATIRAVRAVRAANPDAFVAARTGYLSRAFLAREVGADHVTVEEIATADAMRRQVLEAFEARRKAEQSN